MGRDSYLVCGNAVALEETGVPAAQYDDTVDRSHETPKAAVAHVDQLPHAESRPVTACKPPVTQSAAGEHRGAANRLGRDTRKTETLEAAASAEVEIEATVAYLSPPAKKCTPPAAYGRRVDGEHDRDSADRDPVDQARRDGGGQSMEVNEIRLFVGENRVEGGRRDLISVPVLSSQVDRGVDGETPDAQLLMSVLGVLMPGSGYHHIVPALLKLLCQGCDVDLRATHSVGIEAVRDVDDLQWGRHCPPARPGRRRNACLACRY